MDLKIILSAIYNNIIAYGTEEILYAGSANNVPKEISERGWLAREILLTDKNNYNSDYKIIVY